MTDPVSDDLEVLRERLGALIDRTVGGDETREVAAEALEELAVAIEEIQAQNAELAAGRGLLEAERERYRTLFHTVPDGFLITTIDGIIVEANQTAADLLGRPLSRLLGRPLATFVVGDDHRSFYHHLGRLRSSEVGTQLTLNLTFDDHETFPANLRATVVNSGSGTDMEVRWLLHDRRGELETEALRASEERLRALFETAQVGVLLCDTSGAIVFSNRHGDELLGRRGHQVDLHDWTAALHDDDRSAVDEMVRSVGHGGRALSLRYRVTTSDGTTRWVDHTTSPLKGRDDANEGSVSTLIDSTAEVDAAAELRRSRDFANAMLDTVGALVVVLDRDARIVRFNRACELATGWTGNEAVGRSVVEFLVPPEQRASVTALLRDMLEQVSATSQENDWVAKDGHLVRVSWRNTVLVDECGEVVVIVCTGIDVTRQRLLESRLAQTDRLESAGRLAAGIAHDFNNTLAVLRLRIERLPATDQEQRDQVDALIRTIENAHSTIVDLLSFSRHQELVPVPIDVNAELQRHTSMLHDLLGDDIELQTELTDDDSTTMLDPARFEQIIVNLAVNARDAMPAGGTVTLKTAVVELKDGEGTERLPSSASPATLLPGEYLCVSMSDTGVGIAPGDLAHVFDPYFTTKPPGRGTGLGLATAYGTVTQSGGEIVVESELGAGTTFTLWLPASAHAHPRAPAAQRSATVLLVEDDVDLREVLADELVLLGHDAIEAHDGAAGLEQIGRSIDLLVTDVQMPGVDGVELAEAFIGATPGLPVLFVTGLTSKELDARLPPGARLLKKPFRAEEFRTAVTDLLDERT